MQWRGETSLSSSPPPTRTALRGLEWPERKMPSSMPIPTPNPVTAQMAGVPHPATDTHFLVGRWLLYLLGPVLFCCVGGSIPVSQKLFGEVTSPLYPKPYPSNFERTTVITVPTGFRVKLVFWQFDLEPSEGCLYDYVKVGDQVGRAEGELGVSGNRGLVFL